MPQPRFPPSDADSAHRKDTINAIEDNRGSFVLPLNGYLAAPVLGESIDDAARMMLFGRTDSNGAIIECNLMTMYGGIVLFSMPLPKETAGLTVRTEGKAKTKSFVAVDSNWRTLVSIWGDGTHVVLNPTGEVVMMKKKKGKFVPSWSSNPEKSKDTTLTFRSAIDVLVWQALKREFNAGRAPTLERIRIFFSAEIDRQVALRRGRKVDHGNAHFFIWGMLRDYAHVSGAFNTNGGPPRNGGVFLDISAPEQTDLDYAIFRNTKCPPPPQNISGLTTSFFRPCSGKKCRVTCLQPSPMTCRDPTQGGLGQGMPLGFETGDVPRVRCRMLLGEDAAPSQVLAAVNCNSADPSHACMGQSGSAANKRPRLSNTSELNAYMSTYCTKMAEYATGDPQNDCPVDPISGLRPNKCPNALRLGRKGEPGPADACRRWQRGSGADAAHSAYVSLCSQPENQPQPWCDCIAGSLPGGRYNKLHVAARKVPFTTRQNEGCWFPPCAKNDYTLQRRSDIENDLGTCQVACVNVISVNDSSNVNMADVSQQMTCSVGRETISVRTDESLLPQTGVTPPPQNNDDNNNNGDHLLPTPPPNVPDTINPTNDHGTQPAPRPPVTVPPQIHDNGTGGNLILGMERNRFLAISGGSAGIVVIIALSIYFIAKRKKRS